MMKVRIRDFMLRATTDYMGWMILAGIVILAALITPRFGTWRNFTNIIIHAIPLGLTIYAMTLCLMSGNFDLSLESTFVIAPTIAVLIITRWFPNIPGGGITGIIITILIGGLVGLTNGVISKKIGINPFLVTLCMMMILRGFAVYLIPRGIFNLPKSYAYLGSARLFNVPVILIVFVIMTLFLYWIVSRRVFGRRVLATGSNDVAAFLSGIPVVRVQIMVFVLAGMLAALGGLLSAGRINAVLNMMGEGHMILQFAGAVLGGASLAGGSGSVMGAVSGILILQTISNILTMSRINPYLIKVAYGFILLVAVLLQSLRTKLREIM